MRMHARIFFASARTIPEGKATNETSWTQNFPNDGFSSDLQCGCSLSSMSCQSLPPCSRRENDCSMQHLFRQVLNKLYAAKKYAVPSVVPLTLDTSRSELLFQSVHVHG